MLRQKGASRNWLLVAPTHGGRLAINAFDHVIPLPLLFALGGWFVAWHGLLQHEAIHRHPTRSEALNALVGGWPLSLWLPYRVYRHSHLLHHSTGHSGDPHRDPKPRYLEPGSPLARMAAAVEADTAGRLLAGPFFTLLRFWASEVRRIGANRCAFSAIWAGTVRGG